jgi:hypothetical protein
MDSYAAAMLWRLENQDEGSRRQADEQVGRLVFALRRVMGDISGRGSTVRRDKRNPRTAPVTG